MKIRRSKELKEFEIVKNQKIKKKNQKIKKIRTKMIKKKVKKKK